MMTMTNDETQNKVFEMNILATMLSVAGGHTLREDQGLISYAILPNFFSCAQKDTLRGIWQMVHKFKFKLSVSTDGKIEWQF